MDASASDEYERWGQRRSRETTMANIWYAGTKELPTDCKGNYRFGIRVEGPADLFVIKKDIDHSPTLSRSYNAAGFGHHRFFARCSPDRQCFGP
jgi:hypothetical protein